MLSVYLLSGAGDDTSPAPLMAAILICRPFNAYEVLGPHSGMPTRHSKLLPAP